jgi:NAD(P)-dependent dehydrogenase (short-subunit alcohol dehydrogenase family)
MARIAGAGGLVRRLKRQPGAATLAGLALGAAWWTVERLRAGRTRLTGQVAIVTGSSRGLGLLVAKELAREGCRLVICSRDPIELERARHHLVVGGADVLAAVCDVSKATDVDRLVAETLAHFGRIDILVNNAGIIHVAPVQSLGLSDFEKAMSVSFWGTVHTALAVLPHMRARRSGRIVNVTSIGGKVAVPHLLPYDCAKFAAVGFSEGLTAELARDGITVTTIVPGLMRTGSYRQAQVGGNEASERRWFSLAARLPGLAMSPRRAARQIVGAAKRRRTEQVIGVPARLLRIAHALFPRVVSRLLAQTNRLLPAPAAI